MITRVIIKGGAGSGHRGHRGRPGKRGGSLPSLGLTLGERESLIYYTARGSVEISHALEYDDIDTIVLEKHIKNIDRAISKTSVPENMVVYRGTTADRVNGLKLGDEFTEKRFTSTSLTKAKTRGFSSQGVGETEGRARIDIEVPKGSKGLLVSDFSMHEEDELLLPRGTSFKVISTSVERIPSLVGGEDIVTNVVQVRVVDQLELSEMVYKGGPGSGHRGHRGRPGKRGGSVADTGNGSTGKVWQGEQQAKPEERLSKLKTGAIGEELAMKALEEKLGAKFSTLNNGINNAPIDVGGDHHAIEVKTGLASNGKTAQHWRATIGQPGKKETELIKKMSKEEKRAHHTWKKQKILERKNTALREMEKVANAEIKPATVGVILSPDGKRGDVYFVPGFHLRLPWKDYATDEYHIGTYDVDELKEYFKGGPGSGHRGHSGRPGKRGGSLPSSIGIGRTNPSNPDEKALMEYLNQVAGLRKGQKPEGFVYAGMEDLVLKHGRFFEPPKEGDKLPEGCNRGPAKECFRNAIMNKSDELIYTEGYATTDLISGFGFEHAWLTTLDGKVVDPTWESGHGLSYFGVRLNGDFVLKTTLKTEVAGIIVNDWMTGAKLMRKGFPEGALYEERKKSIPLIFTLRKKGGPGSGHRGHRGRPGKRGGSLPSGSGGVAGVDFNAPTVRSGVIGKASALKSHLEMAGRIHDALTDEQKAEIERVEAKIKAGTQTIDKFRDADGNWDSERAVLHEEIITDMMADATPVDGEPDVIITGGLPGSGKSTVLRLRGEEFSNHVHVDSDAIKARLPEYEGWNAGLLHEESSYISGQIMERGVAGNYNIIYDATLKTQSSSHKIVDMFEDIGYNSKIVFVDVPMETAMNRAVKRFFGPSRRYVPLGYLATHDNKNRATVESLKGKVDSWEVWDTSKTSPVLVSEGSK